MPFLRAVLSVCFFEAKFVIFGFLSTSLAFFKFFKILKKGQKMKFCFFGQLDFVCCFRRFKDDFGRCLGTVRFLDTIFVHRIIHF